MGPGELKGLALTQTIVKPVAACVRNSKRGKFTSHNLGQKTRPYNNQEKKKKSCKIVDFVVPADNRVKLKECEKKDKYLDIARELKKLWNMKLTFIPIVIGSLGTVNKELIKGLENLEIRGRMETMQITALLISAKIWRRVLVMRRLAVTQTPVKDHQLTLM